MDYIKLENLQPTMCGLGRYSIKVKTKDGKYVNDYRI